MANMRRVSHVACAKPYLDKARGIDNMGPAAGDELHLMVQLLSQTQQLIRLRLEFQPAKKFLCCLIQLFDLFV